MKITSLNKIPTLAFKSSSSSLIQTKKYSNYLGFKTLNLTPDAHFEDWNKLSSKKEMWEKNENNKWYYDSEEEALEAYDNNFILSDDESINKAWENNFRFKLGENWVGIDEDSSSSSSERLHTPVRRNKWKELEQLFYSPLVDQDLPKEQHKIEFTLEDVPEDIQKEDIDNILKSIINQECINYQKYQIDSKFHLIVELSSQEMKEKFLNSSRLNFGLWIKGKRCDVYDTIKRQKNVYLSKIPKSASNEDVKTFINKILEQDVQVNVNKQQNNTCKNQHPFFLKKKNFFTKIYKKY